MQEMQPLMGLEVGLYLMVPQPNLPDLFHNSHSGLSIKGVSKQTEMSVAECGSLFKV